MRALPGALPRIPEGECCVAHFGGRGLLWVELHDAQDEVVHIAVKVRDHRTRVHSDAAEDDAGQRLRAVTMEDAIGDLRVQPLLLRPDPHVVVAFSGAARCLVRAMKPAAASGFNAREGGQLDAIVRRHVKEPSRGAVVNNREDCPELFFQGQQLAHQRLVVHRQA